MKVRNAFVANSSSSSFIIGSNHRVETGAEVKEFWLNNRTEEIVKPYREGTFEIDSLCDYLARNFKRHEIKYDQVEEIVQKHLMEAFPSFDEEQYDEVLVDIVDKIVYYIGRMSTQEMHDAFEKKFGCKYYNQNGKVDFQTAFQFEADFIREKHEADIREAVQERIDKLKQYPFIYVAEFGDDTDYEGSIEHNEILWTLVPYCIRISHH